MPEFVSVTTTSLIVNVAVSSFVTVPRPLASVIVMLVSDIPDKSTVNVSSNSTRESGLITTLTVLVSPAVPAKFNIPEVSV